MPKFDVLQILFIILFEIFIVHQRKWISVCVFMSLSCIPMERMKGSQGHVVKHGQSCALFYTRGGLNTLQIGNSELYAYFKGNIFWVSRKNCELPRDWFLKFFGVILGCCANAYLCFKLGLGMDLLWKNVKFVCDEKHTKKLWWLVRKAIYNELIQLVTY